MKENKEYLSEAGSIIRGYRKELGLSQEEAARRIGISRTTLQKAENGHPISAELLKRVLNYYEVTEQQYNDAISGERIIMKEERNNIRVYYNPLFEKLSPEMRKNLYNMMDQVVEYFMKGCTLAIEKWEKEKNEGVEDGRK